MYMYMYMYAYTALPTVAPCAQRGPGRVRVSCGWLLATHTPNVQRTFRQKTASRIESGDRARL